MAVNEPPRSKLRGIPKIIQSTSSFPDPRLLLSRACLIGESRNKETGFGACPVLDTGVKPENDTMRPCSKLQGIIKLKFKERNPSSRFIL
jgi:hypothetical protein